MPADTAVRHREVVSRDGTRLQAWTNDAAGPTVLLCNGLGTNPHAWPALLDPGCGVRVLSWAHRGVGGSERPTDPERVDVHTFVEDAVAVMEAYEVGRCVVAGWSMGVNTAFQLAVDHPGRVSGLFAVGGVPGGTYATMFGPLPLPAPARERLGLGAAHLLRLAGPALSPVARRMPMGPVSTAVLRHSGFMLPRADPEAASLAVREFLTTPVEWYMHMAVAASRHVRVPLEQITVPTSFVAGRWDVLAGARDIRRAAEQVAGSTYVELPGSHFLPLEFREETLRLLHELVDRVG